MVGNPAVSAEPRQSNARTDNEAAARELATLRQTVARNMDELVALRGSLAEPRATRAAYELGAAIDDLEKAAHDILSSSETIDESARTLTATLKTEFERGLAQDIQDQVVRIFEACNFQDLTGQRIGKAIAALAAVEQHIARMLGASDNVAMAAPPEAPKSSLLNGPKLDGDRDHKTQHDIDAMFG